MTKQTTIVVIGALKVNHNVRKCTFGHVCPAKIQISLSDQNFLLDTFWIAKVANFLHVDNQYSEQTVQMHSLI